MTQPTTEWSMMTHIFHTLARRVRNVRPGGFIYWKLIACMQELANKGYPGAIRFMRQIDLSRAPKDTGTSWSRRLLDGPRTTSFRGARRQLHADPGSQHKTFGMCPH